MFEFLILMLITVFGLALLIIWLVQYDKVKNAQASKKPIWTLLNRITKTFLKG